MTYNPKRFLFWIKVLLILLVIRQVSGMLLDFFLLPPCYKDAIGKESMDPINLSVIGKYRSHEGAWESLDEDTIPFTLTLYGSDSSLTFKCTCIPTPQGTWTYTIRRD